MTRDEVVKILRLSISSGERPVGSRLPSERELAENTGVSRSVIREALRSLSEQGFVTIQPARGAFVRAPAVSDAAPLVGTILRRRGVTAREVIAVRRLIESENSATAALNRTDADLLRMRAALADFETAKTRLDQIAADLELHSAIASASGNQVLEVLFVAIAGFTSEIMLRSLGDPLVSQLAVPQHGQLVDAIAAGDDEQARRLMLSHIDVAQDHYGDDLDRPLDVVARDRLQSVLERLG